MITDGSGKALLTLHDVLSCLCRESWMMINEEKSNLFYVGLDVLEVNVLMNVFPFLLATIEVGLKYLGFRLKPCIYFTKD